MPRAKRKIEDNTEATEATEAPRKRRRAKAETKAKPAARRGRRKTEEVEETKPAARRGRRSRGEASPEPKEAASNGSGKGRSPVDTVFTTKGEPVWGFLSDDEDSPISMEKGAEGKGGRQVAAVEIMAGRGKRKTTAAQLIDAMVEEEIASRRSCKKVVSNMINIGLLITD